MWREMPRTPKSVHQRWEKPKKETHIGYRERSPRPDGKESRVGI